MNFSRSVAQSLPGARQMKNVFVENEPIMAMYREYFVMRADGGKSLTYVSGINDNKTVYQL